MNNCHELTVDSSQIIILLVDRSLILRNDPLGMDYHMLISPVEPRVRLRLICEVIAIFTRTIRNSQRPSIIIIYRRSPNSYRAAYSRHSRHACESTPRTRTLTTAGPQSISLHYGAPLARIRDSSSWPCLELWLDTLHRSSSILIRSVSSVRARVNVSPGLFSPSSIALTISPRIGPWPFREQNRKKREKTRRACWSGRSDRSIDRPTDRPLFDRRRWMELRHLRTRVRVRETFQRAEARGARRIH